MADGDPFERAIAGKQVQVHALTSEPVPSLNTLLGMSGGSRLTTPGVRTQVPVSLLESEEGAWSTCGRIRLGDLVSEIRSREITLWVDDFRGSVSPMRMVEHVVSSMLAVTRQDNSRRGERSWRCTPDGVIEI